MAELPVIKKKDEIRNSNQSKSEVMEQTGKGSPFFSFCYTYKSMTCSGGKTHIKAEEKRYENGKFESKTFEGTMDGSIFADTLKMQADAMKNMQQFFLNQMSFLMNPFK